MTQTPATDGYNVVDNRRTVPQRDIGTLPIENGKAALDAARLPVQQVIADVLPYAKPKGPEETKYELSQLELVWGTAVLKHAQFKETKKWLDTFKEVLPGYTRDATLLTLHGREVATYRRNGQLNLTELRKEQPDLVAKYTKLMTSMQFDETSFAHDHPDVYAAYRARRLVFVSSPKPTGITLPE